jgi:AcrR family transcriptional regulator
MAATSEDKRTRLVKAAAELGHAHGLGKVALADIAQRAEVPLGNVYYYFKTKAAIAEAVIAQRCAEFQQLRERWDEAASPRARLKAFVQMTVDSRESLARAGCPVGSLCAELGKEEGPLADAAALPFRQLLTWIEAQFAAMGRGRDKTSLAIHLLAALQGVSLLANCFRDPAIVTREARQLNAWIDAA